MSAEQDKLNPVEPMKANRALAMILAVCAAITGMAQQPSGAATTFRVAAAPKAAKVNTKGQVNSQLERRKRTYCKRPRSTQMARIRGLQKRI
jgi:hypothetical protein